MATMTKLGMKTLVAAARPLARPLETDWCMIPALRKLLALSNSRIVVSTLTNRYCRLESAMNKYFGILKRMTLCLIQRFWQLANILRVSKSNASEMSNSEWRPIEVLLHVFLFL